MKSFELKSRRRIRLVGVALAALCAWVVLADGVPFERQALVAAEPDWSTYTAILQKNVARRAAGNFVNYAGIKQDARWPEVVRTVAQYPTAKLNTRNEKLAFYINAYNILVIDLIVRNYPVADINRLGDAARPIWKRTAGKVGGRDISLDALENEIVRPFGDPRIHFALNCGALSCPDLRREAYTSAGLNRQMAEQTRAFLNDAAKGLRVDSSGGTVHLSKIFEWFAVDFKSSGGVETFVRQYRKDIAPDAVFRVDIEYDWRLNGG